MYFFFILAWTFDFYSTSPSSLHRIICVYTNSLRSGAVSSGGMPSHAGLLLATVHDAADRVSKTTHHSSDYGVAPYTVKGISVLVIDIKMVDPLTPFILLYVLY